MEREENMQDNFYLKADAFKKHYKSSIERLFARIDEIETQKPIDMNTLR